MVLTPCYATALMMQSSLPSEHFPISKLKLCGIFHSVKFFDISIVCSDLGLKQVLKYWNFPCDRNSDFLLTSGTAPKMSSATWEMDMARTGGRPNDQHHSVRFSPAERSLAKH